jgi:SAM-dependent methyltransferase
MRDDDRVRAREHWQRVYGEQDSDQVSWFEPQPAASLGLIEEASIDLDAAVIDVGGGASGLAGELLARGHTDLTVADISAEALAQARRALGAEAERVTWVEADLLEHDFGRRFALWHDRAVFHFMVEPAARDAYLTALRRALEPGGHLVIATFGPDGPTSCSGLPVQRYGTDELTGLLPDFDLTTTRMVQHLTPGGNEQQFLYARLRKTD